MIRKLFFLLSCLLSCLFLFLNSTLAEEWKFNPHTNKRDITNNKDNEIKVNNFSTYFDSASPATVQSALRQITASYPIVSTSAFASNNVHYYTDQAESSLSAEVVLTGLSTLSGLAKGNGSGAFSAITDSSANWDTAYNHSQDNTQAHSDYLLNSGSDIMAGTLTADGFTLGANENLTIGTETFTFDAITSNDFELSDDLNINDTTPHLKLIPAVGDAFEIYAYASESYFVNYTDATSIFRVNPANNLIMMRNLALENNYLSNDGNNEGISIDDSGNVTASGDLTVAGDIYVTDVFVTNVNGDSYVLGKLGVGNSSPATFLDIGKNGAGGIEGIITLRNGVNPGTTNTLSYTKWADLEAVNGIVKSNGSGDYSTASAGTDFQGVLTNSAGLLAALNDETGTGLSVFNNSPTFADDIQLGLEDADGILKIYSEQGATDYIASLYTNTAMTSAASFFLPADEPTATSFINMTTGGVMGFVASNAGTDITADLEEEVTEGSLADSTITSADIKNGEIVSADLSGTAGITLAQTAMTAGRSLTISTNDIAADEECYAYKSGYIALNPVATDDIPSVDHFEKAVTITKVWCESDQTVVINLQRDDGTPANMLTADVTCDSTGGSACASGCDTTLVAAEDNIAADEEIDLVTVSVSGTPTRVTIKWFGTYDD